MSSNRLKVLVVSLLAVFAISAVASSSASANGQCYKVITGGSGGFEDPSCMKAGGTKEYAKVAKLETEIKTGEWCAKSEPEGTGTFNNNACTEAGGTKNFLKVKVPSFWVCREVAGAGTEPPIKYDNHLCNTKAKPLAERKWSFLPVANAELHAFEGTSGPTKFESFLGTMRVLVECGKDKVTGEDLGARGLRQDRRRAHQARRACRDRTGHRRTRRVRGLRGPHSARRRLSQDFPLADLGIIFIK